METLEERRLLAVVWDRVEPLGSLIFQTNVAGEIGAPVNLFEDDFESGVLDPQMWFTQSSTPDGRVDVSNVLGTPSQSGNSHLAMDRTPPGVFNLNEAILTLDLSGQTEAALTFFHKSVGDEPDALPASFVGSFNGDGVSISDDGIAWHTLVSLNSANSPNNVYTGFEFDLDAEAASAGISLGSNFHIKFQQYDNFPFNSDGRAFDDVTVTTPGTLSETTTAFLEADQTLTVVAGPEDDAVTLTAIVRDPGGTVIASAAAAGPGETLEIQTIGIAGDGDYKIEISGDSATDYGLSLYRNTVVEVFDTDDGNEQDATGSFIPLGSGRFGIVGQFEPTEGGGGQERPVVWATQPSTGNILKLDPVTGEIIDTLPAPDALSPNSRINGLSIAEDGDSLLYVNGAVNGNDLYRLDPDDGSVLSVEFLPTDGNPGFRGGLSFESEGPDAIFAIDNGAPVDRQSGFGGPLTNWTPAGIGAPGALGGDDNGRLFVFQTGQIREYSTTIANTELNSFSAPPASIGSPLGLAFDGVHLYSSDAVGNLFTLDPDTGEVLNQVTIPGGFLSGLGADLVGGGGGLQSGPIYTTQADGTRLGTIDKATGVGTDIGAFGTSQTWAAAFDTDGTLYTTINGFSGNAILASLDQSSGAATTIGSGLGTSMISLEVAADGTMYGIGYSDQILYEIDQATGVATPIGNTNIRSNMDLAIDSAGVMYATVGNQIWTVDTATGSSTQVGSFSGIGSGQVMGIMFDEANRLFATAYVTNSPLYEIDVNTLAATIVGDTGFDRPHGGDILITSSGPAVRGNQAIAPPATPEIYGDPGEPGRFPPGPNVPAQVAPGDLLVNGSFETGDFTGWTTVTTGGPFRPWAVSGGGVGGGFGMLQTQPQDGAFVAWNGFDGGGPMEFQMYQDVSIPADSTATLEWMDRVQWNFVPGGQATLPRLYDVEIRDPATNAVLQTVFSFSTGTQATDPTGNTNWQTHSVDVSAFAGQDVRLFFREQIPQSGTGPAQIEFDAVSLRIDAEPVLEPDVDEYLLDLSGKVGQPIDIAFSTNVSGTLDDDVDLAIIVSEDDSLLAAPVDQLRATGLFDSITVLNTRLSTPTLTDLEGFESILAYTNIAPSDSVELGNVLADYVDSGGHLAMATYAYSNPWEIEGRITSAGYSPLTNLGLNGPVSGNLVASLPSDPIFTGIDLAAVTYFNNVNFADPGVDAGATLLATDGIGHNMIARNAAGNVVGLNFYPRGIAANSQELFDLIGNALVPDTGGGGGGDFTLELLDTDGVTVLASAVAVSENFDLGILDFVVPADGVYTLRATSASAGSYGIVVTDPLVFDTEPNQPTSSPLRSLDTSDGALGFLSDDIVGGDVDLSLLKSFESLTIADSGFIPPDPIIAAGPTSVVGMVNTDIVIHDKNTGTVLAQADLDGAGGFWATTNVVFDPWIAYDPDSERFFAIGIDRSTAAGGSSRVYLAVSTDSAPTNLTTDWNKYIIDRTGRSVTGAPTFPDYPKLGVDDDAIYITGNDFGINGGGLSHVSLFAIEKAPLLVGGPPNIVYDEVINGAFSVHPVVNYDPGEPMRFAEAVGSTGVRIHTLSNVLAGGTRTTSTVGVPTFLFPPDVPQQGGPPLDSVSQRIMSGVVRDGSLWTGHAIVDPTVDSETVMRWYEIDVSGGTPNLVQNGNVDPGPGVHTWMGHVNVDNDGDMGIAFSISGANQFAGIGYTGRLASDPLGTTRPVEIARNGEGPYSRFDGIGRNRWGDYSGLAVDPDGESFWLYNGYAGIANSSATFVGQFQVEPGGAPAADVDTYEITLAAGQQIGLSTTTPFDDPIDSLNLLDPLLEILDPSGASVDFDSGSAADGKNAAIPLFTAAASGVYKVIVGAEDEGDGEYVLSVNWAPVLGAVTVSAGMIFENESISVSGSYSDQNFDDSHTVVVDWDDPNDPADSTFSVPAINTLSVGDTFSSTTDGAVLEITSVDRLTGEVGFEVTDHQYLDDGPAPGNGTAADLSRVSVTVTDDGGLTAALSNQELVTNGDFETGDLTGWTVTNSGSSNANWLINDGTLDPFGPAGPLGPISGNFDAVSVTTGPNLSILSEPIVVPDFVTSAVLSWSDVIRNYASQFQDPIHEWRVLVLNSSGGLIQEVFSTNPGDPLFQLGPNDRSFDLTTLFQSLAGQTVQISFEQQSQLFWFNINLDNVSLQVDTRPGVLVKNVDPIVTLDPVAMISENEAATLTGTITDQGLLDEHDVTIDWDDPNDSTDATFALPATAALVVGDAFISTTDGAVLEVTAVDLSIGEVSFTVQHVYADDGPAPGNNTPSDVQLIRASVSDDDGLVPSDVPSFLAPVNLGSVNTAANDVAPTLSADGLTLYFHSNRAGGSGGADIWQATRSSLAEPFGTPTNIGGVVNSSANETAPAVSRDGLSLFFSSNRPGGNGSTDLWVATRGSISDPFGAPVNLGTGVNTNLPEFAPAISADGLSLYFQRRGGAGGLGSDDVWVATRASTSDPFGTAVNLSSPVNSSSFEGGPFVSDDQLALYYGSNRAGGEGQIDLYIATRATSSDAFGAPINLGVPINSTLQDFNAHVGPDGLYFHSNRPGGQGGNDLWFAAFTGATTVLVKNVAPLIDAVAVSATKDNKSMPGDPVTLAAKFTDQGLLDRHDVVVGWDDGTADSVFDVDATADLNVGDSFVSTSGDGAVLTITGVDHVTGEVSFELASHQFATGGIFDVVVTISDDDTGVDEDSALAWVSGVRVKDGVLQVIGTSVDDHVTINQQGNGILKVHADFLQTGNFETFDVADVDKILAYLCEGDDHFTIAGNVDIPAIVHGDGGDDHLNGGGGPTALLGNEGDDELIGGNGRDVLIGGLGADRIVGGTGDDVLIGGSSDADTDDEALMELLTAWNSGASYDDRVAAVDALLTVIDDEDDDKLTGSSDRDLFYDGLGDRLTDVKTKNNAETVI